MAINIYSLVKSEVDLKNNFLEFFSMCQRMCLRALNEIQSKEISEDAIEKFLSYKIRANEKKRDIRDECIWTISKDQPRASHLRFIIAILYSIRDLERVAEQSYNVLFFSKKFKLPIQLRKFLGDILQLINVSLARMYEIIKDNDCEKYEAEITGIFEKFKEKYKNVTTTLIEKVFGEIKNKAQVIYNFSIVMKYLDRIMDHMMTVYDNFLMIKNL